MTKTQINTVLLSLLIPMFSMGQKLENVRFEQQGKTINIYYDLSGTGSYEVRAYCKHEGQSSWGAPLGKVTGNVGKKQKAGTNKAINWDVLAERERLTGDIAFKVEAKSNIVIEMVFVKGGTFTMGSNDGGKLHEVTVSDFNMGKYEVTQKQWKEIMRNNPSYYIGCDDCPVENISWTDVQEFIKRLNAKTGQHYRLPTETEWEYAARGGHEGRGYKYAGSNDIDEVAWYGGGSGKKTHPVGTKQANELGIYDMSGNVWEWCADWYGSYNKGRQTNPDGPSKGSSRVRRGGSWYSFAISCKVAFRYYFSPDFCDFNIGFRLALP